MFKGVYTAVITPFTKDGQVDYDSLSKILKYQENSEVSGVVILGSTAEEKCLTSMEKFKIIKLTTQIITNKQIIVGVSSASTDEACQIVERYNNFDIDGYLVGCPYYVKPTQNGLYLHFEEIAKKTQLPICIYNVPSRTGTNISSETVGRLSNIKNIVAIKDATGSIEYAKNIIDSCGKGFSLLCGNDDMFLEYLNIGASGIVSVLSNAYPQEFADIFNCYSHDRMFSESEFENLKPIINNIFQESNPIGIKYLMSRLGFCENVLRLPLTKMTDKNASILNECIK